MHTTIEALGRAEVGRRLRADAGLNFEIGPFRIRAHSRLSAITEHVMEMYGRHRVSDSAYADIHCAVETPPGLRALVRRQVVFRFDDQYPFKPLPHAQARPFFEWGLNWCIATTAHQYLIIHAGVVARGERCALIPGRPGAGKSTLCAALVAAGWRLLSDEMALIDPETGRIWPVPRPVSLKNESIAIIRERAPDMHLGPVVTDTHKGTVTHLRAPADSVAAADRPARPAWVVYPAYEPGVPLGVEPVESCRSVIALAEDSYNFPLLGSRGFHVLTDLAQSSASYRLRYSSLDETIAWFDALAATPEAS